MKDTLHKHVIISTDLDGTLLDHYTYSWQAAKPSLEKLAGMNIPIVINTSKTYAEVLELQQELNIDANFIVENGSAIYLSKNSPIASHFATFDEHFNRTVLGVDQNDIVAALNAAREEHSFVFESYADWSVDNVIEHTGLSLDKAKLNLTRQFSVPLIWQDEEHRFETFKLEMEKHGLNLVKGGRFVHILGRCNKGIAIDKLRSSLYPDEACSLICLGDSYNDLDMLEIADIPKT